MNYTMQSFNFRGRSKLRPFYDVIASIAAEEYSHIELVSYAINLLLTGSTERGTDPTTTPLADAVDACNAYHFIASGQTALPVDSMGNPGTARMSSRAAISSSICCIISSWSAVREPTRSAVYEMVDNPTARAMVGYLLRARRRAYRGLCQGAREAQWCRCGQAAAHPRCQQQAVP